MVIVAAGLSPAWQQILSFDDFQPSEVNRARDAQWCGSGKVLNVGLGLSSLGAECCTIAPLGGAARQAIEAEFRALGAPLRTIACGQPTRICTTILNRASGETTELVENARKLLPDEVAAYKDAFAEVANGARVVVLTGSLPAGVAENFYSDLLERAPGASAVLDARGPELRAALPHRPLIVKPNREELARTVGRNIDDDASLRAAMRDLNAAGAQWVVVSSGKHAVYVSSPARYYRLEPPHVAEAINPIGCGDALAAGIAVAVARGDEVIDAVRFGMAAATDRLRSLLPGRLDPRRVAAIAAAITAQTVEAR